MIGFVTVITIASLACLAFAATRWMAVLCLIFVIYFYPLAVLPIALLLVGAFFLFKHFR